jgi:hypothetical protein
MGFSSETAKLAGKKSRRGKGRHSSEIRQTLSDLATKTLNTINTEELSNSERIALLRILVNYTVPKLQTERIETNQHKHFTIEVLK